MNEAKRQVTNVVCGRMSNTKHRVVDVLRRRSRALAAVTCLTVAIACAPGSGATIDAGPGATIDAGPGATIDAGPAGARTGCATWAGGAGGGDGRFQREYAFDVKVLGDGSALVVGTFEGTSVTFGPQEPGETTLSALPEGTGEDGSPLAGTDNYVAKYDTTCKLVWVKQVPGTKGNGPFLGSLATRIATFPDGSFVMANWFQGTQTFESSVGGDVTLTAVGAADVFLAKFDATGGIVWVRQISGLADEAVGGLAALSDGSFVVAGGFEGSATFGSGESAETTLVSEGDSDIFIARYTSSGLLSWAKRAGGPGAEQLATTAAALPDDAVLVGGYFKGTITFGPGEANETTLTAGAADDDAFWARFDSSGRLSWVTRAAGEGDSLTFDVAAASDGSFAAVGAFRIEATFGQGEPGETVLSEQDYLHSLYVARFHADGQLDWAVQSQGDTRLPGPGFQSQEGMGVGIVADGSVIATGGYLGPMTLGPGEPGETTIDSPGGGDVFIATYEPAGTLRWLTRTLVPGVGDPAQTGMAVATHPDGSSWVVGHYGGGNSNAPPGPIVFFPGEEDETLLPATPGDFGSTIFVARYRPE